MRRADQGSKEGFSLRTWHSRDGVGGDGHQNTHAHGRVFAFGVSIGIQAHLSAIAAAGFAFVSNRFCISMDDKNRCIFRTLDVSCVLSFIA